MIARRAAVVLFVAAFAVAPSASAWTLIDPGAQSAPMRLTPWMLAAQGTAASLPTAPGVPMDAAACALGDVNGDGVGDLLVRVREQADGPHLLKALPGPAFTDPLWTVPSSAERTLHCAPDLNLDGVADPVSAVAGQAAGAAPQGGAVTDASVQRATQVIDGFSGGTLIQRQLGEATRSAGSAAGDSGIGAASRTASHLLPAAPAAEALLTTEIQQATIIGLPEALPVAALTATARQAVTVELLDIQGTVQGTITIDEPGVDPLALAPLPAGAALPDVAALTARAVGAFDEASQRIPTLTRYHPDGTVAWATELAPTQGLPMLVPLAGDLDLDGIQDLVVQYAPTSLAGAATGQFQLLSGLDGSVLLDSGAPIDGAVSALPLGLGAAGNPLLLVAEQVEGADVTSLSVLGLSGQAVWTVDVAAGAVPVNLHVDEYTGDVMGLLDLTGDGVPDVGAAAAAAQGLSLQAVDGATGSIAWARDLADASRVMPLPVRAIVAQAAGAAPNVPTPGVPTDLLAIAADGAAPALTLLQGSTGEVVWAATAALPAGVPVRSVAAQAAGDLDADGIQDILVTVESGTEDRTHASVHAVSGHSGETLFETATEPGQAVANFTSEPGPAFEEHAQALDEPDEGGDTPGLPVLGAVAAVAVSLAVAARGRRR